MSRFFAGFSLCKRVGMLLQYAPVRANSIANRLFSSIYVKPASNLLQPLRSNSGKSHVIAQSSTFLGAAAAAGAFQYHPGCTGNSSYRRSVAAGFVFLNEPAAKTRSGPTLIPSPNENSEIKIGDTSYKVIAQCDESTSPFLPCMRSVTTHSLRHTPRAQPAGLFGPGSGGERAIERSAQARTAKLRCKAPRSTNARPRRGSVPGSRPP